MNTYFTILTFIGAAKLANATALGQTVKLTQMAIGDGNGSPVTPQQSQSALIHEVRRADLNSVSIDSDNANWIICEVVIPADVGGFTIREVGIYDSDKNLIAVGNFPATYKPKLTEGSGRTQTIRIVLEVSSTKSMELKIDPSVVLATREYVDKQVKQATPKKLSAMTKDVVDKTGHTHALDMASSSDVKKGTGNGLIQSNQLSELLDQVQNFSNFNKNSTMYLKIVELLPKNSNSFAQIVVGNAGGSATSYTGAYLINAGINHTLSSHTLTVTALSEAAITPTFGYVINNNVMQIWMSLPPYSGFIRARALSNKMAMLMLTQSGDKPSWTTVDVAIPYTSENASRVGQEIAVIGTNPPTGALVEDGSEISRTTYAELYQYAVSNGAMAANESIKEKGQFGPGDGSTTFTLPDVQGLYISAHDTAGSRVLGSYQSDAIRNITGTIGDIYGNTAAKKNYTNGAFYNPDTFSTKFTVTNNAANDSHGKMFFDASKVVPTDTTNHPQNVSRLFCVYYR
ncbi:MAG: hypothetical protein CENE_02668 [Candidatus Celerinatantimonas neptuna]|nr:MAG: hypothetical protein CENE_02668 [Candidatus Celerinatantimonas neptuna]